MPTFDRDGVRLFYEDEGGPGLPLVLHTGGAGSGAMWRDGGYVERLAGEFRVILHDHRGRGRSDRPGARDAHAIAEYAADVASLADELGLPGYGFFGYSFGGAVGFELAATDPRLRALAALGTVFDPPEAVPAASDSTAPVLEGGMDGLIEAIEQSEGITLPGWLRADFASTDPGQFSFTIEANGGRADPWPQLGHMALPVALVAGAEEDPDRVQDRMAAAMPDATSTHIPRAGHVGAFLQPDAVLAAAVPALRRASRQTTSAKRS
jgi:pimeloyl-ACP methyl ester carboxylesterase